MKAVRSAYPQLLSEEARQISRESQEGDWRPEPTLAYRAAPCTDASGGPPDRPPSDWSRPGPALTRRPSLSLSALDHPLDPSAFASFLSFRRENGPIARPFHPSGNRIYDHMRRGQLPVGSESLQGLVKFTPNRKAHVLQSIGAEVSHNLMIPVLNFPPLQPHVYIGSKTLLPSLLKSLG